ncbi:MAG TPA: response regulator [Thermoguttaceae bacterium]|nr:response regulator [Thermoguttaceae bacterium]
MPTILVVDDSAVDRRLVGSLLQKRNVCTIEHAASGVEALARMKDAVPDLVVTDLTMPAMNGLELVKAVRIQYPDLPVILMTAHGSEALAIEALEQGAASYVPKSRLADKLPNTVVEVLSLARADRSSEQLLNCLTRTEFSFSLDNDAALIDPLVDLIQKMVAGMQLCDFAGRLQIGVALKEALLNALFHGNLEITQEEMEEVEGELLQESDRSLVEQRRCETPYRDRRVAVDVRITANAARFVVRDEGPGFDIGLIPDSGDVSMLEGEHGRGLSLMRTFMDELTFNETGNEVTLLKRRDTDNDELEGTQA